MVHSNRRAVLTILLVAVLMMQAACLHRSDGTKASPFETAVTYNAVLAETNNGVAKGVIMAQGAGLLSVGAANTILTEQRNIAVAHKAITAILAQGQKASTAQADQITALLNQIQSSANKLVGSGVIGVKNPASQNTFQGDITLIGSLGNLVVTNLKLAGVLK
jgi:hypothetical protein